MAYATNILQTVQTYQRSSLAYLQNLCPMVKTANTKFKDFDKISANLGSSVAFDLPPRFNTTAGLVASWQAADQRVATLNVDQSANTAFSVTAEQRIFNLEKGHEDYMEEFGKSAVEELASEIEANVSLNAISAVKSSYDNTPDNQSGPYRAYGWSDTQLTSFQQLATAISYYKNYGSAQKDIKVYLPDIIVPAIVGSGLNQFAPRRNDDMANSWEIGEFGTPAVRYYASNLLPIQVAGTVGVKQQTLTVVSTNDATGNNVTEITFSGADANTSSVIKAGDIIQFQDGVTGQQNIRYLTFIGHAVSSCPVQVRALSNADSDGTGNVTVSITPTLNWAGGPNINLNTPITAGMQIKVTGSHRAGLIVGGNALFIAMPRLPEQSPYATANEYDLETGISVRLTYGSVFGQNQTGMVYDAVWGSFLVPEYSMRLIVPLSQG